MQINLSNNGLLKAWMNRNVKNYSEIHDNNHHFSTKHSSVCWQRFRRVPSLSSIMISLLLRCVLALLPSVIVTELVPWVSRACQGDEFVSRCSGMCVSAGPPLPLLTFVTSLTSAHSLLGPGQDPRCVNNADTLQDLVGNLGALKPGIWIRRENSHIYDGKTQVQRGQFCLKHC